MTKIRKAVIPAAGSRRIFPFDFKYCLPAMLRNALQAGSYTAHGAIAGGRADHKI